MDATSNVRMANQIADFFRPYGHDEAVIEIANHINRYWEPRMRLAFFEHIEAGGAGLAELVKDAAPLVRRPGKSPPPLHEPKDAQTGLPKDAREA